jgi:ribosomal protein S21
MIKRFIKKVKKEGIVDEWRQKYSFYEKPTDKRRRKKQERKRVIKRLQREYDAKYKD